MRARTSARGRRDREALDALAPLLSVVDSGRQRAYASASCSGAVATQKGPGEVIFAVLTRSSL